VEVFPGASTAGYEDNVSVLGVGGKPANAGGDFRGAARALDGCGIDQEVDGSVTTTADLDDVAEGGALEAGDDSYAVRERGKGSLVVEEAFATELVFEGLGGGEEGSEAGLLHGFGYELELAAGLVDRERAGDADGVAVLGPEAEKGGLAAEEDDGELRFRVFEGEIAVATGSGTPVGDFAFDDGVAVGALDEVADVANEVADGEHLRRGRWAGRGWRELRFWGSAEGAGLLGEDVGGGYVGGGVEERSGGGGGGAEFGFAGVGAAEVGEAGDVVGHRRDDFSRTTRTAGVERSAQAQNPAGNDRKKSNNPCFSSLGWKGEIRRFGGGSALRGGGVRGGRVC